MPNPRRKSAKNFAMQWRWIYTALAGFYIIRCIAQDMNRWWHLAAALVWSIFAIWAWLAANQKDDDK